MGPVDNADRPDAIRPKGEFSGIVPGPATPWRGPVRAFLRRLGVRLARAMQANVAARLVNVRSSGNSLAHGG